MGVLTGPTEASVIVVTHNSSPHLEQLLRSMTEDEVGPVEVIIVDNGSSDDSAAIAEAAGARVLAQAENLGFSGGCHVGADAAKTDTLVFLNPDTVVSPGWLPPLIEALGNPAVGAACATVELGGRPGIAQDGVLTFYGVAWASDVPLSDAPEAGPVERQFPTGAVMAIRRSTWRRFDGFRRDFFMYLEDADLGWRLQLAGLRTVRVPASRVSHDYEFSRNPDKMFHLERNRLLMLRTNYRPSTLVALLPALAIAELGILAIAVRDGWAGEKVRAWRAAWTDRGKGSLRVERVLSDSEMLARMEASPADVSQVHVPGGRIVGAVLGGYAWLARHLLRVVGR